MELMQLTCKELGEANAYITDISQKTVRERLAEILVHLKNDFGLDDNDILQISLTREELANIVGTATESVIRCQSTPRSVACSGHRSIVASQFTYSFSVAPSPWLTKACRRCA